MKKILLAVLAVAVCFPAYAQDAARSRDNMVVLEDFSGMLKSHVSPYLLSPKDAVQAINVRPNEKYGSLVKRSKRFLLSTAPTAAVKSLYRYGKADGSRYTIGTYSTNVVYISSLGAETVLWDTATDAQKCDFITYKDVLVGVNGYDNNKKWDGKTTTTANTDAARTANNLMADLGAPFAELNTGPDLEAAKWYQYKVAFYDGSNYTYSTARSNPILTGAAVHNIYLTDIPLGPTGTTARMIYRTTGQTTRANVLAQTAFYKVARISDNSTRVYADTVADSTLITDVAPSWATVSAGTNVTPPAAKYATINAERLFLANDASGVTSGKSSIYWSDLLNPDYFNYLVDYELIRPDDGDEITFIKNVLGILTIGKVKTINKFYTNTSSSDFWTLSDPFSYIGCVAPFSAVNARTGLIYLGRHGIYSFNGQTSTLISDVVTDKIRDILSTSIENVVGAYHDNRYLMSYTSAETGAANNNRVLIFDLERNAYYQDIESIDSFAVFDSGEDFGTLFSGASDSSGDIYAHKFDFSRVAFRYKSEFDGGTPDSINVGGTEANPEITLGSDDTWAESTDNWEDSGTKTWVVENLAGYWYSPVVNIEAAELDKLYWNERLGVAGDITMAERLGSSATAVAAAAWSSEFTAHDGSDLSGITANDYIQFRATLTTSLWTESPILYSSDSPAIRMTFKKEGTTAESSILAVYETGKINLGARDYPARIKEVHVYYEGDSGTLNVEFDNNQGDTYDFDIDLSVDSDVSATDQYFGTEDEKVYVYFPTFRDNPVGRFWSLTFSEEGEDTWQVNRVVIRTDTNDYTTYK